MKEYISIIEDGEILEISTRLEELVAQAKEIVGENREYTIITVYELVPRRKIHRSEVQVEEV